MPSLRTTLDALAKSFASDVLAAIRGASLAELTGGGGSSPRPRAARDGEDRVTRTRPGRTKPARSGRLARRSPEDIARSLASIVALVKKNKGGLRSEQIRAALKLDKRELPRVLAEGLKKRALKSKGQKRATTYFAA